MTTLNSVTVDGYAGPEMSTQRKDADSSVYSDV